MRHKLIIIGTVFLIGFGPKIYAAEQSLTVDDRARLGVVYSLERLRQYDKAIPTIEALQQHYAGNREVEWTYARVLGFGGHWKQATAAFDRLCASKCDEDMFVTYAHILESQGPDPETLPYIKKLSLDHPDPKIESIYNEILAWNVQNPKGSGAIGKLYAQYPQDLKLARAYAQGLIAQKKYTAARALMDKLLSQDPTNQELRFQHAQILAAAGDHQQAVKELQALIDDGSKNKEVYIKLGDELRGLGRDQEALKIYGEVVNEK